MDANRIRNLATKNAFVTHETCRRSWKSLTLLSAEADMQDDGFTERFKFDSTPPRNAHLRRTPSLEDSDYLSLAATVNARVIDDQDDATSPPPTSARVDTAPSSSAHRTSTTTLLPRLHLMGTSRRSMSSNLFGPY